VNEPPGAIAVDRSRLPGLRPVPRFSFPAIVKSSLANGLGVWSVRHEAVPLIGFLLIVRRGAADDPQGQEGLAALTADMLDEGTGAWSAIEVHQELARIGAQFDIDIGADATLVGVTVLNRFAERGLNLLADIVVRPTFADGDFVRVRQLRLNRLIQLRDMPGVIADRAFARLLYGDAPYGHTPLGNERTLAALTLEDVRAFHGRLIRPGAATLVAVGDCEHETVRQLADAAFGDWREGSGPAVETADSVARPARLNIVPRPGASQSELRIGHVAVTRATPDYHALVAANMVLGGQYVSRINLNLRQDKGITYGARTAFDFRRLPGPFALQASVDTLATALAIRESIGEITAIRGERPVSADELAVGVAALTRGYARNFETADQIARAVAQLALYGLPDDYYSQFVPRVEGLTPDEVMSAAARHLDPARLTTLIVGDVDAAGQELGRLNLGDPVIVSADSI
jgi:predicted Zn-dependent peptidase